MPLVGSLYMVGFLVGCFLFGDLADRYVKIFVKHLNGLVTKHTEYKKVGEWGGREKNVFLSENGGSVARCDVGRLLGGLYLWKQV